MKLTVFLVLVLLSFSCFALNADVPIVEVRPPVLKYSIFSTLADVYAANVTAVESRSEFYRDASDQEKAYYAFLLDSYGSFSDRMKKDLETIITRVGPWRLMNIVTPLDDEAEIREITRKAASIFNFHPLTATFALRKLLPAFYDGHFKEFFESNAPLYVSRAEEMTKIASELQNPFSFIEEISGIRLGDYDCIFYYSFQRLGAYGFRTGNSRISTIQHGVDSFEKLYATPFHEYSHEFFQTFTNTGEFKDLAEELKSDSGFYSYWDSRPDLKNSYSLRMFCKENLVEGFAQFLYERFYRKPSGRDIYYYDVEFYEFLREIEFDADEISLKEASFKFFRSVLEETK